MLLTIVVSIVCLYVIYGGFFYLIQRWIVFPGTRMPILNGIAEKFPGLEEMWIQTSSGQVEAWYLPPSGKNADERIPVAIFAHGNAEQIDTCITYVQELTKYGLGILLVEYPGFGRSQGEPSQHALTETFTQAYDYLIGRPEVDSTRVILIGRSLGGGVMCALAGQRPSAALILLSTFTSVRSFSTRYGLPGFLSKDPFDNLSVVKDYDGPILILHGTEDSVVPFEHSELLYSAAKSGTFTSFPGGHIGLPWNMIWDSSAEFLKREGILNRRAN